MINMAKVNELRDLNAEIEGIEKQEMFFVWIFEKGKNTGQWKIMFRPS